MSVWCQGWPEASPKVTAASDFSLRVAGNVLVFISRSNFITQEDKDLFQHFEAKCQAGRLRVKPMRHA
jgi:hypothetical protein